MCVRSALIEQRTPALMTSAGSSLSIVTLLQTCWLSLSKGNLPSVDVLSLLLSKVTSCRLIPPPPGVLPDRSALAPLHVLLMQQHDGHSPTAWEL